MNIFLTQFWTEKLLIHKPQPRLNRIFNRLFFQPNQFSKNILKIVFQITNVWFIWWDCPIWSSGQGWPDSSRRKHPGHPGVGIAGSSGPPAQPGLSMAACQGGHKVAVCHGGLSSDLYQALVCDKKKHFFITSCYYTNMEYYPSPLCQNLIETLSKQSPTLLKKI